MRLSMDGDRKELLLMLLFEIIFTEMWNSATLQNEMIIQPWSFEWNFVILANSRTKARFASLFQRFQFRFQIWAFFPLGQELLSLTSHRKYLNVEYTLNVWVQWLIFPKFFIFIMLLFLKKIICIYSFKIPN